MFSNFTWKEKLLREMLRPPPPPFSTALGGDKFRNKLKYLFTIISMQMLSEVNRGAWRLEVY